jgi:hypothetical protein
LKCIHSNRFNTRGYLRSREYQMQPLNPNHSPDLESGIKPSITVDQINQEFPVMTYKAWKAIQERNRYAVTVEQPSENTTTAETDSTEKTEKGMESHECIPTDSSGIPLENQTDKAIPLGGGDSCAVCLEAIENDDDIRGLKCGHCYHQACIDPWLISGRTTCPLCKQESGIVPTNAGDTLTNEGGEAPGRTSSASQHIVQPPPAALTDIRTSHTTRFVDFSHHQRDSVRGDSSN